MYTYHWYQWMLFFYIYCIIGWCFESTYVSMLKKRLVNRGFLHIPMLPIYGFGAVIMLLAALPVKDNLILIYICGMTAATALEYVTGVVMESLFKVRYWDYSKQKFNYKGHICLSSSLTWGLFSVLLLKLIHQPIESLVISVSRNINLMVVAVLSIIFVTDTVISVMAAWDLRVVLVRMTRLKDELEELEERVRNISAETVQRVVEIKDDVKESVIENIRERTDSIKEKTEKIKEKVADSALTRESLTNRLHEMRDEYKNLADKKSSLKVSLTKRYPTASSRKFGSAWEDLKRKIKRED